VPYRIIQVKLVIIFFYSSELRCGVTMSKDKKQFTFPALSLISYDPTRNYQVCQMR